MGNTFSLWVGGAAGDGIASAGETFTKICARAGLHAFAYNSYQSVIRGGHVLYQVVVGRQKQWCPADFPQILVALNQDTINREAKDASLGILYNKDRFTLDPGVLKPGARDFGLPIMKLAPNPLMQNTVCLGALLKFVGLDFGILETLLGHTFKKKGAEVVAANVGAAKAGYEHAARNFPDLGVRLPVGGSGKMVITGNQAIGLGAIAGGCKFYSAYPMTPASSIMHWLAPRAPEYGMVFKQAEDELAAMNMAVGAGNAGVRAMTGTSGGGFALMTEAVSLAAMLEAPVVVVTVQRGGPSTGLPTKTEQADLFQVLGAGQGDYPKAVLAPATMEEAFRFTALALNLSERYQTPVILVSDLLLSEHDDTLDGLDMDVAIDRGVWALPPANGDSPFLRYRDTETGVSPRAVPGQEGRMFVAASDEHNERGDVISDVGTDPVMRVKMMDKRMRKMAGLAREMPVPTLEGPPQAELTLLGWGSTYGILRAAMEHFNRDGRDRVNLLVPRALWPFPSKAVADILCSARKVMALEASYTGQLCRLLRQETGFHVLHRSFKYDGEPFYPGSTFAAIEEVLKHG